MDVGTTLSRALRWLLLLAFVVQSSAVQAHVHSVPLAGKANISAWNQADRRAESLSDGSAVSAQDDCPLCREAAMAGHYVLPAVGALPPPPAVEPSQATAVMAEFGLARPGHGWLSRAPPR